MEVRAKIDTPAVAEKHLVVWNHALWSKTAVKVMVILLASFFSHHINLAEFRLRKDAILTFLSSYGANHGRPTAVFD